MSQRNGDRARFQINRKRKVRHRQRIQALAISLSGKPTEHASGAVGRQAATPANNAASHTASRPMPDAGGPMRTSD